MTRELFGEVAVRLGFTTKQHVDNALRIQDKLKEESRPHKLIGIVMLEMGFFDTTQFIAILKEMQLRVAALWPFAGL
jgi:hypothetical protein